MFFFFSKILSFTVCPLTWIFILFLFALLSKKPNRKRNLVITACILLLLFSNKFLLNEAISNWEAPSVTLTKSDQFDYGIVLGGYSDLIPDKSRIQLTNAGDRIWQALQLYKQKKIKKIILTGWSGLFFHQEEAEADKIKQFLISLEIPEKDIITESLSRNTHENAQYTTEWLKKHDPAAKCIVITSAFHIKRALACFKKYDKSIIAYPTNFRSEGRQYDVDILLKPDSYTLYEWDILFKEISGYYIYKIMGYL